MKRQTKLAVSGLLMAALLPLAACGGDDSGDVQGMDHQEMSETETTQETTTQQTTGMERGSMEMDSMSMGEMLMEDGEYSDERFIDEMAPHHQGAVDMAEVALDGNAEHRELVRLSEEIISTQNAEIEELRSIKQEEFGSSEIPMEMSPEEMEMMGMSIDPEQLAGEDPFDLAFIDEMIPHHQSAIEMSEVALENSDNERIRTLAENIIAAQEREIEEMETWREEWYPEG